MIENGLLKRCYLRNRFLLVDTRYLIRVQFSLVFFSSSFSFDMEVAEQPSTILLFWFFTSPPRRCLVQAGFGIVGLCQPGLHFGLRIKIQTRTNEKCSPSMFLTGVLHRWCFQKTSLAGYIVLDIAGSNLYKYFFFFFFFPFLSTYM